ncbi:hypothetical protein QVN76_08395 [Yersinia rochesterensis]|uniref:hypothetical protein n=1 Tax=Yersinia rochesterensis TaxID=1604335 RepID=UPI0025AA8892|nr:hypothetical protein [Yersinia rochesterensis]MDN0106909.1 hypothetical protein [Yersinia rochesterensis]
MIKLIAATVMILLCHPAFSEYKLSGKVNGLRHSENNCHISIKTNTMSGYSNIWHYIEKEKICKLAQLAYVLGKNITINAQENSNPDYASTIVDIAVTDTTIQWPPYNKSNHN